jgi:hypothetical protein
MASNAYEEHRAKRGDDGYILVDKDLVSRRHPEAFRNAMTVEWLGASMFIFMGVTLLLLVRRQERLDPLSPEFQWQDDKADP